MTNGREGEKEELVARCSAFCNLVYFNLIMTSERKAVFSKTLVKDGKEETVYYCGFGKKDCIIAYLAQKLNDTAQVAHEALHADHGEPTFR